MTGYGQNPLEQGFPKKKPPLSVGEYVIIKNTVEFANRHAIDLSSPINFCKSENFNYANIDRFDKDSDFYIAQNILWYLKPIHQFLPKHTLTLSLTAVESEGVGYNINKIGMFSAKTNESYVLDYGLVPKNDIVAAFDSVVRAHR